LGAAADGSQGSAPVALTAGAEEKAAGGEVFVKPLAADDEMDSKEWVVRNPLFIYTTFQVAFLCEKYFVFDWNAKVLLT